MSLYDDNRAAWSARPNTWTAAQDAANTVPAGDRVGISWHYPGSSRLGITPASSHAACFERLRDWQADHQAKGWADIGYNVLICPHARAIEGRGVQFKGSHSPGVNWPHYGVQLMVSNDTPPTPAMYARAVALRAALEARSGRRLRQWGHQDDPEASTACPGAFVEAWVKAGGPYKTTTTTTPTPTPTQEDPVTPAEIDAVANGVVAKLSARASDGTTLIGRLLWGYRNSTAGATTDAYAYLREAPAVVEAIASATGRLEAAVAALGVQYGEEEVDPAEVYAAARQAILDVVGATLHVEITAGPPTVAEPAAGDPHEIPPVVTA